MRSPTSASRNTRSSSGGIAPQSRASAAEWSRLAIPPPWRFREVLDPDQPGGSEIALPPDDELKADLASAQWELTARGIKLKPKDEVRERI
jgi:hypothetical protein